MTSGDLANAPLIVTDIPTSDVYVNQTVPFYQNGEVAGGQSGNDLNRRYYYGNAGTVMLAMDNVPNSFGRDDSQKGIIGIVATFGYDGQVTLRTVMHKPTSNVKSFITGWDLISGAEVTISGGNANVSFAAAANVASQRQGEYAYAFMYYARYGLFTDTLQTTVYKITRDEYIQVAATSGGDQVLDGWNTDATIPAIQVQNGGQFFVSDEEEPFIWNISGSIAFGGTATMTGFRDDNSQNVGSYYTRYNNATARTDYYYYGQSSAYLQTMTLPKNVYGYGPYIVHPWSSGNYSPPELWFFVQEFDDTGFRATGRFRIYRSRWKKGAYKKPPNVFLADDDDFTSGRRPYPTLNPYGYAWETEVINDEHYLGVIGPFDGIGVYNPQSSIVATLQNKDNGSVGSPLGAPTNFYNGTTSFSTPPFGFTVVRDKKRQGTLHIVAMDGGNYPASNATLNRIWFANSSDDGKTWSRMTQINPSIVPATQGNAVVNYGTASVGRTGQPTPVGLQRSDSVAYSQWGSSTIAAPSVVRTHDDVLLTGNLAVYTNYSFADGSSPPYYAMPADTGSKVALAVIDYTGRGVGSYDPSGVVFVQQATRGQTSWQ